MTLYEIKQAVANILGTTVASLTVDGTDMFLVAANQVRKDAEQNHDFEFQRRLVDVSVSSVTGGTLSSATTHVGGTPTNIKTIIEVGLYDADNNLRPVEWTNVAESLERQREDDRFRVTPPYLTDDQVEQSKPPGVGRFEFVNDSVFRWPRTTTAQTYTLGMEVYAYAADWTTVGFAATATVTGTLSPDVTGTYTKVALDYGGYPVYLSTTGSHVIQRTGSVWVIMPIGSLSFWGGVALASGPAGTYSTPYGSATGVPVVTVTGDTSVSDVWTTHGSQYLIWGCVVFLNHIFQTFVPRQEGSLPPPVAMMERGLESLKAWDTAKFEAFRRHGR